MDAVCCAHFPLNLPSNRRTLQAERTEPNIVNGSRLFPFENRSTLRFNSVPLLREQRNKRTEDSVNLALEQTT